MEGFSMPNDSTLAVQMQKVDSIKLAADARFNALNNQYDSIGQAYAKITGGIQHQIDSLHQLGQPADEWVRKLDSLNAVKEEKLFALKSKSEKLKKEVSEKLISLNLPKELNGTMTEYMAGLDNVDISVPGAAFSIPELNIPEIKGLNFSTPAIPQLKLEELDEIKAMVGKAEELKDDLPDIKLPEKEKIAAKVEEEASALARDRIGEMPGLPKVPATGEEAQQQLVNKMKEQALDHFGEKQEILRTAMDQISEYKQKFSEVQSLAGLPQKASDPIKKKTFVERLVPGLTLQYQRWNDHMLDINIYTGYRFTSKLTVGAGWNQRIAYDADSRYWNHLLYLYGPRLYGSYHLGRGFIGHIEGEAMHTFAHHPMSDPKGGHWEWVYSMMTGLKKEFRLTKQLKGTSYLLYNIFDPNHKSPYVDRLNARFGVEYKIRKKPRQTE
jgi:hypothetical protein